MGTKFSSSLSKSNLQGKMTSNKDLTAFSPGSELRKNTHHITGKGGNFKNEGSSKDLPHLTSGSGRGRERDTIVISDYEENDHK